MWKVSPGYKPGKPLTKAQKTSSYFVAEPRIGHRILRRNSNGFLLTDEQKSYLEIQLARLVKAEAIVLEDLSVAEAEKALEEGEVAAFGNQAETQMEMDAPEAPVAPAAPIVESTPAPVVTENDAPAPSPVVPVDVAPVIPPVDAPVEPEATEPAPEPTPVKVEEIAEEPAKKPSKKPSSLKK